MIGCAGNANGRSPPHGPLVICDHEPARRVVRRRSRRLGRTLLVAAALAAAGRALVGGVGAGTAPTAAVTVTVRPGDTLWSIAASHFPDDDIRRMVEEILSLNHLSSPVIQPGEALVLPAG